MYLIFKMAASEVYDQLLFKHTEGVCEFLDRGEIKVTGGWRKLHNEELHNLYSSPSIIRMIKSRRMRWAEHVARMGVKRNAYRILVGKPELYLQTS
jgi:hypothetical protein